MNRMAAPDLYRHADLFEFAPFGYLTLTADGLISAINLAGEELLGAGRSLLTHQRFDSLVIAADKKRWSRYFSAVKKGGRKRLELTLQRCDGVRVAAQLDCEFKAVGADGTAPRPAVYPSGLRMALSDVTARKNAEAKREQSRRKLEEKLLACTVELAAAKDEATTASRAKASFLANASHELRTPLTIIMGMTELMQLGAGSSQEERYDMLDKVAQASRQLLALINELITLAAIEAGQVVLDERNFSLARVLDDVVSLHDAAACAKGLSLSLGISPALPEHLCGDASRLGEILGHFVDNAIKFSERGQVTVRARAIEEDTLSVLLRIEVSDQGIGISAADQMRLFAAFTQVDGSSTRKYSGAGLGLILCHRIARLMGGNAGLTSEAGVGSTFWANVRLRRAG